MNGNVVQRPTMHIYFCRTCQRGWKQENFSKGEWCVYCGSFDTFLVGMETTELVMRRPGMEPHILWWSKDADLEKWPEIKTTPKWLFAITHPILYWRMFGRKGGQA